MGNNNAKKIKKLELNLEELKNNIKKKDFWDKFSIASTFLSTVLLTIVGSFFTYSYNIHKDRENNIAQEKLMKINEITAAEKFIPHLTDDKNEKRRALATILLGMLGSEQMAVSVAMVVNSPGTREGTDKIMQGVASIKSTPINSIRAQQEKLSLNVLTNNIESKKDLKSFIPVKSINYKIGWVYFGEYTQNQNKWNTKYLNFPDLAPAELLNNTYAVTSDKLNIRDGMPTADGYFNPVIDVLDKGEQVTVKDIKEWQKRGYMWAKIEYIN